MVVHALQNIASTACVPISKHEIEKRYGIEKVISFFFKYVAELALCILHTFQEYMPIMARSHS